jgi:hypothetical protein
VNAGPEIDDPGRFLVLLSPGRTRRETSFK